MSYCPHCGNELGEGVAIPGAMPERDETPEAVRIAEIQARRDVDVARIAANADRAVAETQGAAQVDSAEALAEVVAETAAERQSEDESADDPAPVVINAPDMPSEEPAEDPAPEPPESEGKSPESDSEPPEDKPKRSRSYGNPAFFG